MEVVQKKVPYFKLNLHCNPKLNRLEKNCIIKIRESKCVY